MISEIVNIFFQLWQINKNVISVSHIGLKIKKVLSQKRKCVILKFHLELNVKNREIRDDFLIKTLRTMHESLISRCNSVKNEIFQEATGESKTPINTYLNDSQDNGL